MADLISREALLSELEERFKNHQKRSQRNVGAGFVEVHKEWAAMAMGVAECLAVVRDSPAVDAEPVKRGRWIKYEGEDDCECSVCLHWFCVCKSGKNVTVKSANYCPNCGAKMDLEG